MNHDRDLTQAERQDAFGTKDNRELFVICEQLGIKATPQQTNPKYPVIWRTHLPRNLEHNLQRMESAGRVYVGGFKGAAS
ncbi:hypothetical protein [uncultured Paraglaciecola sp.]|uniref:hypothetical protein n=1 Tax=uncultured Paraglaciecola sp. TaxID=1765024 RepID=UPI00262FE62E|nr:hypothetical protein [uncultured Paraglaciecola sp.]